MLGLSSVGILVVLILLLALGVRESKGGQEIMSIIRVIYVLTITAFLIMLVAFGISAFYQPPESPEYSCTPMPIPVGQTAPSPGTPEYEEWQKQQEEWEKCNEENSKLWEPYNESMKDYYRNVFFISYPCGLLFVVLGLALRPRLDVIKPGLLLGGMGTIIYAIAQADLISEIRFAGVAVGLIVLLYVGYKTLLEKRPASEGKA